MTLTKTIEGGATTAQVGDIIRYRIHFACSNLTTACGAMEITDVLDAGLTYVPAQSSVPSGFTMTESPPGTIKITYPNLLDGSQYDAVIAVLVDYDLRPLPQFIDNTVTGQIDPDGMGWQVAPSSNAPQITVGPVTAAWAITKTLYSPSINPTVDTDVTYQINLCPTTTSGNVALSNISIVDTLPVGAAFVSASNGGAYAPGPGTVTWSVTGPVYPPNCITRFVTIRYNSPSGTPPGPFIVTDNVTNTVNFDGDYIPSTGTCTSPCSSSGGNINHDIDPIAEVPTYSKGDAGDPVGFTGTGRFILNLNTNNTNYPSNNLILIDNLPPELQVTGVTSGAWPAAFDYVHAIVEYSTNNGFGYTAFGPAVTGTDTPYTTGLPAKITNVRWRFEYDPDKTSPFSYTQAGLPYTWSFTTPPQIRITPRATPINTDLPTIVTLPAAVAGNTYNNCLRVSRTDSTATPVLDACDNETMTVQGDLVSLRASKNETPGGPWDDLSDPTILTFTPDTKILPGDTVKYTLTLELTERSSEDLVNPTIQDTLPGDGASPVGPDFVFVRNGTATLDGGAVVQPTFTQVGQVLKWEWPSLTVTPLPLGSRYLTVEFYGYVPRGQDPGTYINTLYAVTDSNAVVCEIGSQPQDSGDVDTDGNTTEFACQNPDPYVVERSAALRGEKWIRSTDPLNSEVVLATTFQPDASCPDGGTVGLVDIPTNPFTRYPCISQAFPEGALPTGQFAPPTLNTSMDDFEYNLRVFNDGNVPMLKYVLYDILPRVGDTGSGGVLSNAARQSEFRPAMTGPIQFIQGPGSLTAVDFTIEYNMTTNPCRPEVFDQPIGATVPGGCDNTWVLAAGVADWTLVRSYRIRLNNNGSLSTPSIANAVPAGSELRFGVPLHILADAPPTGFDTDDALSHEIAWNSFSHVGSYDKNTTPPISIEDLLASEPRKVGITVPERMSVGNRIWRDADNSGTINAPDDTTPGIPGVTVNLYRDANNDGIADGGPTAIATTTTDTEGYYLFSNIPYDAVVMNNNRYIIGVPTTNNYGPGQPLENLRSSTGTPAIVTYTTPTSNVIDNADDGIDPVTAGLEVFSWSFTLQPGTEPTSEADLSNNNRDGLAGQRRGVNGERNNNSDLTVDFGFFGGTDIPFSIGNHVWKDNGQTVTPGVFNYAQRNDGIRQTDEPPVVGALVRLYRDGNANGLPEAAEMIRTDLTDVNGFYLFDNLDPGPYFVEIPASNFATGQPLAGWYSSQPTGTENTGVNGGTTTADIDNDDNGINSNFPEITGIFSGVIVLTRGVPEPLGETFLSGEADPGSPANQGYNPTGWDGPGSIGRFVETDATSNVTIDFGFIPPMSLGNRVWIDEGAGTTPFRSGYNNGLQDGAEAGVSGVIVQLWRDTSAPLGTLQVTPGPGQDTLMDTTTTDATGYYLFQRMQPASDYFVYIPNANFTGGGALVNYLSSTGAPGPADSIDKNDNGIDQVTPATTGIASQQIAMQYNSEPLTPANETDINISGTYGPLNVGTYGQQDGDSNLTMDFGFVRPPRSIGNRLWIDTNNNGAVNVGEPAVPTGVAVSLYLDTNANGIPDDVNGDTVLDNNDAIATDLTDVNGYYLFDKLPPNNYIVGVDRLNFVPAGLLDGYNSSKGSVDNATNNTDNLDNGVDRLLRADPVASPHGILSTRINLTATPVNAPTGEVGSGDTSVTLGFNPTAGDGPLSRGRYGETDANSDLTIDFGFFIPMSLGNRVFLDDGTGGGTYNNGIMDGGETPIASVRVELWHDVDANGVPDAGGMVGFDTTDAGGYYLFDDLAEGSYVVLITGSNFTGVGPLVGRSSSTPTGTENVGVAGNPYTPNTDRDDNGINNGTPATTPAATPGILSGTIVLAHGAEPTGEAELSGQADPGAPANLAFSPTGWDGPTPGSRGRWDESDNNSNLTIDFGFIPVFALGNRVWFDTNNNSLRNGAEVGINNVRVRLYASDGTTEIPVGPDGILNTPDDAANGMLTSATGYYRFNNLPAGDYIVKIPASNFGVGQPLRSYWSSGTTINGVGVISETTAALANSDTDSDDNGTLTSGDVISSVVTLGPTTISEPLLEADLSGGQGQPDGQANMTVDFGFYRVEIGNLVYLDNNANGTNDAGDTAITSRAVKLYAADGTTEINVGPDGILGTADDAAGGTLTSGAGIYTFSGLPQGVYIVKTASDAVTKSTIDTFDAVDNATPDTNRDNNDNGIGIAGGAVSAGTATLTPGSTGALGNNTVTNATGTTRNPTLDFGFVGLVGIGNRVWFDNGAGGGTANNGRLDGSEAGVPNVTLELYTSANVLVSSTTTDATGHYQFDLLYPGTYYVKIPAAEFQAGGDLFTYYSSVGNGANETSDENADENGIDDAAPATNGIRSTNFALLAGTESTTDDDTGYTGALPDNSVNFTDDFGFTQKYSIGNRVWFDTNDGSTINGSEVGIDGVTVNLYAASNLAVILATDTTASGGYYLFDDLYPGDYVVSVAAGNFSGAGVLTGYWSSGTSRTAAGALTETAAALANSDIDSDDNGTRQTAGPLNGAVISSTVTLGPSGLTEPTLEGDLEPLVGQGNQLDGRANMTIDFGFYRVEIGNLVFADADTSGHFNAGDTFIQNATVQLYAANGTTLLATTTTNAGGDYRFNGQPEGDYVVKVVTPAGMTSTIDTFDSADNANPDVNTDNNDNGIGAGAGTVAAGTLTMIAAEGAANITVSNATGTTTDLTVDFGFVPLYSLGNRIWFDTNNNSLMDAGEVGVNGVVVDLYNADGSGNPSGAAIATDTTTGGGFYLFDDLSPRDYVVVIRQANFAAGGALAGYWSSATSLTAGGLVIETAAPDADLDATDTDDNGTRDVSGGAFDGAVLSKAVTLGPSGGTEPTGEIATQLESGVLGNQGNQPDDRANMTVDFGFYRVEIGNLVYLDVNGNGNYDGGAPDSVIAGARVKLFASNGTTEIPVGPDGSLGTVDDATNGMLTDAAGLYRFSGLPAGDYIVKTVAPTGLTSTIDTFSVADSTDPDANVDNNDNGLGVGFGTVSANTLTMSAAEVAANITVTNANGTTVDTTVDFGFIGMVAIGNRVWFDNGATTGISNNGILDGDEIGVSGVTLELYTSTGTLVATTTTDATGHYQFDQLYPGTYYVFIPATQFQAVAPLRDYFSSFGNGTDETLDENVDENGIDDAAPATNGIRSINYTLTPTTMPTADDDTGYTGVLADDSVNFTADFGFTQKYLLGNRIWFDTDNSSTINGSEVGIDGVDVDLYRADVSGNPSGAAIATDTTSNGGYYLFDDLYPGDYVVVIRAAELGAGGTLAGYWSSGTSISNAGIVSETAAPDPDLGPDNAVGGGDDDRDLDDNGTLDVSGGAFDGAVLSRAVTLGPGGNTEPTLETDLQPLVGQGNQSDGRANMTVDFGFYTMRLGNLVWSDVDKNGAFNGSETGIDGVPVELWSADGTLQLAATTTTAGGLYSFPGLAQGDYTVHVTAPTGTVSSVDTFAAADTANPTTNTDSNDNGVGTGSGSVASNAVTLTPGLAQSSNTVDNLTGSTANPSLDFGFTPVFALGNRVWFDTDNSGTLNGAEVGIDGVTVNLYAAGDLTTILATQTTANGGYYLFNSLPSGDYVVSVAAGNFSGVLGGYLSSATSRTTAGAVIETTAASANSDIDSDDNGTLQTAGTLNGAVISSTVTLGPATSAEPAGETDVDTTLPVGNRQGQPDTQANMTVDFGFYTIQLGNQVWNDVNNNGLLDVGEAGINGVTVQLWSADGSTQLATMTTITIGLNAGVYSFSGLPAGDYIIRLPASDFNPGGSLRDYRSSTGVLPASLYEPAPDADTDTTDSDDNGSETNGILGLGGYIETLPVTLTPAAEESFSDATGTTTEFRVDLGVMSSARVDLSVTKTDNQAFYLAGGTLNYVVTITNNGPADGTAMTVSDALPAQLASWAWTCAAATPAAYNCTDAASNSATFSDSLDLPQLTSVTYNVTAQVNLAALGPLTNTVTVSPPTGTAEMNSGNNSATDIDQPAALAVTKSDGVSIAAPGATLTYQILISNNGAVNLTNLSVTDTLPADVTYQSATPAPATTPPTGTSGGTLTWTGLSLAAGSPPITLQVTVKVSDAPAASITNSVTVTDGPTGATSNASDTDNIANSNVKALISTGEADSTTPSVLVGESLVYAITITIPPGSMNNLKATDVMDPGLAFDECLSVTPSTGLSTSLPGGSFDAACPASSGDSRVTNTGHQVVFDFGDVTNPGLVDGTLTVQYQVIVLDIVANANGVTGINNHATWAWDGGTLEGEATPVEIKEPQLSIDKSALPVVASYGTPITFTIDIAHTVNSTANAFDVVVTDVLPPGLTYVNGSAVVTGLAVTSLSYNPATTTLTFVWDVFPLGQSASISFQATFIGPSPVTNSANVAWTSLPIDPQPGGLPVQQSTYNAASTERWYDPLNATGVNSYGVSDSVSIRRPASLPDTGFAPGLVTSIPAQPADMQYTAINDMLLEIPALKLNMPIVGIPANSAGSWDLTWLANQAGYLEGTTYPSQVGTTGLTGHVYLADGTPGPFLHLADLVYGNQIILHANGQRYIYEVRTSRVVLPNDLSVFKNDGYTWLTLLTCKDYRPALNKYDYRLAVRAVLVRVEK